MCALIFRSSHETISRFPTSLSVYYNQFLFPFQLVALFSAYLILQHKNMILVKLHKYFQVLFYQDNQKSSSFHIVECKFKRSDKCEFKPRAGNDTVTLASLSMVRLENI